jgi:apolipoprotein D and lipocalin family protein
MQKAWAVGMNIVRTVGLVCCAAAGMAGGCVTPGPALTTVSNVDLQRYAGTWYEIARYPVSFQDGCVGVTATYTLRDDGRVNVVNVCREGTLDGRVRDIQGTARATDDTNARLKVTFFWPFEGDYWVIDLDTQAYQWAVVGEPRRRMLWILSRTPQIDDELYDEITSRLPEQGYDPAKLVRTPQPPAPQ